MADSEKIETRYNYFWIHNVFAHFAKDTLDYFSSYLYPRFEWKVVSTYDKAVEYLNKHDQYGRQTKMPQKPALILDPSGELNFDDAYGKLMYRSPNLYPGFVKYVYEPIYQDENVIITVAFSRVIGEFTLTGLMSSFYEYCDMRIFLNLIFGGTERFIFPQWFNSFIILPTEIYNYEYENDVTGEKYTIDIADAETRLVKTTNTNEVVFPCRIKPRYKLTGMTDASSKHGGTDNLPEWRLSFTIAYEIEMPTYIVLETDYLAKHAQINIRYGSCYTSNDVYETGTVLDENKMTTIPTNIDSFVIDVDHQFESGEKIPLDDDAEGTLASSTSKIMKTRYYHIVTKEEAEAEDYIEISLPSGEIIEDEELLILNGKYGQMKYGDHYELVDGVTIKINKTYVTLEEDDVLEIYTYEYS